MKKFLSIMLAMAMAGVVTVSVSAETVTENGGESAANVRGTYVAAKTTPTVYNVDVSWGSMEFTYTDKYIGDWNPETHEFINSVPASWSCDADANKIVVTNHSNTAISASVSYAPKTEFSGITGEFTKSKLDIPSAVGTEVAAAPNASSLLTLKGDLSEGVSNKTIGTVTVSIN